MEWTKKKQKVVRHAIGDLGLCECGTDSHWEIVLFLLDRSDVRHKETQDIPFDKIFEMKITTPGFYDKADDASERWVEFGAKVLDGAGLLEHGGGIGAAWLTESGGLLLDFLREFGTDNGDITNPLWPDWAFDFSDEYDSRGNKLSEEAERARLRE